MRLSLQTALIAWSLCGLLLPVAHGIPASPPSQDDCGSVTWEGECLGDELQWCEEGQVLIADCGAEGGTCGFDPESGVYDCLGLDDGCGGETFDGRCDGNNVIWCEEGIVYEADCGSIDDLPGALCSFNCAAAAFDCAAPADYVASPEMCGDEGGGGGLQVDFGDSDASGETAESQTASASPSGGCAVGTPAGSPVWLLLGLLGLLPGRTRRLRS